MASFQVIQCRQKTPNKLLRYQNSEHHHETKYLVTFIKIQQTQTGFLGTLQPQRGRYQLAIKMLTLSTS